MTGTTSRLEQATNWLIEYLTATGGSASIGAIKAAARDAGVNERTLYRALESAPVQQGPGTKMWQLVKRACPHCGGPIHPSVLLVVR